MDDAEAAVLTERETEYAESILLLRRQVEVIEERVNRLERKARPTRKLRSGLTKPPQPR